MQSPVKVVGILVALPGKASELGTLLSGLVEVSLETCTTTCTWIRRTPTSS